MSHTLSLSGAEAGELSKLRLQLVNFDAKYCRLMTKLYACRRLYRKKCFSLREANHISIIVECCIKMRYFRTTGSL